jgi:transposase-like protein
VRTGEEYSTDWIQIGDAYCNETVSIRALAKRHGLSDTAIRKEAKKRGWMRPDANQPPREPECKPEREPTETRSEAKAKSIASASVKDLTARGRNIILALLDELEFLNRNHETIAGLVEDYVNGQKDDGVRAKLLKVLDHETRSKTANYLATALAKLNDAAPGKKEQAEEDAKTAGQGSTWGDDLDTGVVGRPN